jgi:hypothetical protein
MNNYLRRPRVVMGGLILAVLSIFLPSCGAGSLLSKEPSPTWTSLKSPTPTATPSQTPTLSYLEWPLVMSETFDEANDNWEVGEVNNEYVKGTVAIGGGKYYFNLVAKKPFIFPVITALPDMLDSFISVKVDQRKGSKTAECGLVIRQNSTGYYFFSISALQQYYSFTRYSADGASLLTLYTNSSKIHIGEPNQISVKAEGQQFIFFINGERVDDARDKDSILGKVGLVIILYKAGDSIEVTFDNFEVRSLEAA